MGGGGSLSHKGHMGSETSSQPYLCCAQSIPTKVGTVATFAPDHQYGCKNSTPDSGLAANGFFPPLAICGLGQIAKYFVAVPLSRDRVVPRLLNTNTDTFPIIFLWKEKYEITLG